MIVRDESRRAFAYRHRAKRREFTWPSNVVQRGLDPGLPEALRVVMPEMVVITGCPRVLEWPTGICRGWFCWTFWRECP